MRERLEALAPALRDWRALLGRAPDAPTRAQTRYYLGVGLLLAQRPAEALEALARLQAEHPDSPYVPFARVAVADHYFLSSAPARARRLYLQAQLDGPSGVRGYAHYMEGRCQANLGDPVAALRAMVQGLKWVQARPYQQAGGALERALYQDLLELYARVGDPQRAAAFYQALGVPDRVLPLYLLRLGRRYEALGKRAQARQLYTTAPLEGTPEAAERLEALGEP